MTTIEVIKNIEKVFAYNLRRLRGDRTQEQVCDETEIPFRTYQSMEDGVVPKKDENRKALCDYFGVEFTEFFVDPDLVSPSMADRRDIVQKQLDLLTRLGADLLTRLAALDDRKLNEVKSVVLDLLKTQAPISDAVSKPGRDGNNSGSVHGK